MRRKNLEMKLQELEGFTEPKSELEQYQTPADIASTILWHANLQGDIQGREVYDLGCGTGTLAIGAKILGASKVVGIDVDPDAVRIARNNAAELGLDINFQIRDIDEVEGEADAAVQNPPFGSQRRGSDRPFIKKALEIAPVVYSLHLAETQDFVHKFVKDLGGRITQERKFSFQLPRSMPWHEKDLKRINVTFYRFVRKD